jgi:hypothetical protein
MLSGLVLRQMHRGWRTHHIRCVYSTPSFLAVTFSRRRHCSTAFSFCSTAHHLYRCRRSPASNSIVDKEQALPFEDDSPYPEVRSAVANTDDFHMPVSTLRACITASALLGPSYSPVSTSASSSTIPPSPSAALSLSSYLSLSAVLLPLGSPIGLSLVIL